MSAQVRQAHITRAVKAVINAGVLVQRVELGLDGTVSIVTGDGAAIGISDQILSAEKYEDEASIKEWI